MDILILAGGRGTRLGAVGESIPKALLPVAGKPLIQHVMDSFDPEDKHRFFILGGYKIDELIRYFQQTYPYTMDRNGVFHNIHTGHDFIILDTGYFTETNGRIVAATNAINNLSEPFMVTYCDSVCNIDVEALLAKYEELPAGITITAVKPISRFGTVKVDDTGKVTEFKEKEQQGEYINGGYMLMHYNAVLKMDIPLEVVLRRMSESDALNAYLHEGFWTCVDAQRDVEAMEKWLKVGRP